MPPRPSASAAELIGWLGLAPHANERCGGFSKGMLQKVALAGALVHDPRLIILDEPLTGLDAGSARQVKDVLLGQGPRRASTVIMTTHILEVAERMAERIGVIANGRLIAEGTLDELRTRIGMAAPASRTSSSISSPTQYATPHERRDRQPRLVRPPRDHPRLARHGSP